MSEFTLQQQEHFKEFQSLGLLLITSTEVLNLVDPQSPLPLYFFIPVDTVRLLHHSDDDMLHLVEPPDQIGHGRDEVTVLLHQDLPHILRGRRVGEELEGFHQHFNLSFPKHPSFIKNGIHYRRCYIAW